MDVQKLISLKHWLDYSSFTFNLERYVVLTNSLLLLQNENHFKKILFWGVIQGLEADYFISFGYEKDALTGRKYFYSDDCQNWKLLPVPQREHLALTELCKRPFQGDPGMVVEVVDDAPPEDLFPGNTSIGDETGAGSTIQQDLEDQGVNKYEDEVVAEEERSKTSAETKESELSTITSGELKEEDRLAAIIHIISEEAAIVPRGGIFKQTDGVCVPSRAFEGIKLEEADSLCSFLHYRIPWNDCNTNLMIRCDYNYAIDFLDTIDKDIPADCWSAQLVEGDRAIILRNLHWPGYMFFHHLSSPDHGFVYVGQGHRNLDIPFMTQVMIPVGSEAEPEEEFPLEEEEEEPRGSKVEQHSLSQRSTRLSGILNTKLETRLETKGGAGTRLETKAGAGTRLETKAGAGTRLETKAGAGTRLETKAGAGTRLSQKQEIDESEPK